MPFQPYDKAELSSMIASWMSDRSATSAANVPFVVIGDRTYASGTSPVGNINNWDTSLITDMANLFQFTEFGEDPLDDVSDWDTSVVTTMSGMFNGCTQFNGDISNWEVSNINNTNYMLNNASAYRYGLGKWTTNGTPPTTFVGGATNAFNMLKGTALESDIGGVKKSPNWAAWYDEAGGNALCFYGFVNIMTDKGLKQLKDLERGDMIQTNEGYQPLSRMIKTFNKKEQKVVKIPNGFLGVNLPSEDIYVTGPHPLSVRVVSAEDDKDYEYIHLNARELLSMDGIEEVRLDEPLLYQIQFDKHYEVNIGGMKFLSHHPNGNQYQLPECLEMNHENRSKKAYVTKVCGNWECLFKEISLKELLDEMGDGVSVKGFLRGILSF